MIAVAAAGVSRRYGRRWALSGVGFEVPAGALVMVTGRNGSGKTTLLRVLATALRPDLGSVSIHGHDVSREREQARRLTALLGHRTHLYEPLTALENMAVAARFLGTDASRPVLLERLDEVGLGDRSEEHTSELQSHVNLVCRLLLEKKKKQKIKNYSYDKENIKNA